MTNEEFGAVWGLVTSVGYTAELIDVESIDDILETLRIAQSSPSINREISDRQEQIRVVAEGFRAFRVALEQIKKTN